MGVVGLVVAVLAAATGVGLPASGATTVPADLQAAATLVGPITTGHIIEPVSANPTGLAANDYVEQEFFASGTATAFRSTSAPSDGKWSIAPTTVSRLPDPDPGAPTEGSRHSSTARWWSSG